jgi:TolB-like protein
MLSFNVLKQLESINRFLLPEFNFTENAFSDYKSIKSNLSSKVIEEKLNINPNQLQQFELAFRYFDKHKDDRSLKNISTLRLIGWLETISKTTEEDFTVNVDKIISDENIAVKQVRALELLLRDIVLTHTGGKDSLLAELHRLFKSDLINKWLSNADETGVLSGTTFSELSSLFLDKRIFNHYDDLFKHENALKYDKNKINSLRFFLEDVRIIRNSIAHNKKISNAQIELLNYYYAEIADIIAIGNKNGLTKLDANKYNNASQEELDSYVKNITEDLNEVKQGIKLLHDEVSSGFNKVISDTSDIKTTTKTNQQKLKLIGAGVVALIFIASSLLYFSMRTDSNSQDIKDDLHNVKEIITGDAELKNMSNSADLNVVKDLNEKTAELEAKRIAIIYFDNTSGEANLDKLRKGLAGMLISDLSNVNMIDIVERDRIEDILDEQELNNTSAFDQNTASEIGKLLGAEIILTGAYFEMFDSFRIDARFIDVETGEILKAEGVDGESSQFFRLEKQLMWKIIRNLDISLTDVEVKTMNEMENKQQVSYDDALAFSRALDEKDAGNIVEAIDILEKIIEDNPDFQAANEEMVRLEVMSNSKDIVI